MSIRWNPPQLNTDGSALTDLAGYRIYMGRAATDLKRIVSIGSGFTRYTIDALDDGTHFFAISAVNTAGVESALSGPVSATL